MNQELIDMVQQAVNSIPDQVDFEIPNVFAENFAVLVAAAEREACAKLADEYATWGGSNFFDWFKKLSAAIRARGEA
jgi:hypothetical protein